MNSNFDSIGLAIASAASSTSVEDIVIKCTLRRVYMEAIKSGSKTYEGRVATDFFKHYLPSKTIAWYCGTEARDKGLTSIISRKCFASFEDMLNSIGVEKFLPKYRC